MLGCGAEDLTKSENFTYDQQARLSAAQTGVVNSTPGAKTWSLQWTYDRFGNRLTQSMLAGDPNFPVGQPTLMINAATNQITNSSYTYDSAGNMTHDANAAYAYDGANRLTAINTTGAVYSYFGPQRIKKVLGTTTTRYIYSGSKPIAEYVNGANANSPSTEYIYAGSKLLATIAGSTITYHHPDHLSNRAETNSSGSRTRTFGHLPYGETWYETTPVDKWKFTTYEHDSGTGETGLDYANFRYYSAPQGRFMSADLLAGNLVAPSSLNKYEYTEDDPVNLVDPMGLDDGIAIVCTLDPKTGDIIECWIYGLPDSFTNPGGSTAGSDVGWSAGNANPGIPGDPCGGGPCGSGTNSLGGGVGAGGGGIRKLICSNLPDGRTIGAQGALGAGVNAIGGPEILINWNTGETSKFWSVGAEAGVTASGLSASGGLVFNLGNSNSSYQGPFSAANVGGIGKFGISTAYSISDLKHPLNVTTGPSTISLTAGLGLTPFTLSGSVTQYSAPIPAGNALSDPHIFTAPIDYFMIGFRGLLGCSKR